VEREQTTVAHIKSLTDDTATVAGYGVIYGGADLEGESFSPQTDFMLDLAPTKLVLYDHSLGEVKHVIGKTSLVEPDEFGLWIEAELDRHKSYVDMVLQLVERGALGWSSGSVGHLTRRNGKSITQWPIVELSLTPTPAEPRTLGVELIKSLAAVDASYQALLPETDRSSVVQSEEPVTVAVTITKSISQETNPMADEETTVVETPPEVDVTALVKSTVTEAFAPFQSWLDQQPVKTAGIQVPNLNLKTQRGDDETKSYAHWIRTGDDGGIKHLKASNNTDMNVGTPADGGYAVPVGHYQQIIAKLRETALYPSLGVRQIPGKGTTVNVPIEGARDGAFVLTAEAATTDRDSPVIAQAPMTLLKYTKRLELSWELMEDEDSNLMSFLSTWVGEGMAITHNTLLVTEALAAGTLGAAWTGGATPISSDDIPELVYALPTSYETGAAWVMRKATEGVIRGKTGTNFQFVPTAPDGPGALSRRELWGFPLYNSQAMPAIGASAKVALFGNFSYMGMRMAPDITFLRDPYSAAITGQLRLHYYFRTVYKVLQAEAILYATQGT
jgi:HK97 family phage major capsid protein